MKRLILLGTLLLLIVGGCENPVDTEVIPLPEESPTIELAAPLETFDGENGDIIPGEYIVVFKPDHAGNPTQKAQDVLDKLDLSLPDVVRFVYTNTIQGFAGKIPEGKLNALKNHPLVAYVEPDKVIKLSPKIVVAGDGYTLDGNGGYIPWGVTRVKAGVSGEGKGKIWIIDTGIDDDNTDLNLNRSLSAGFVTRGKPPVPAYHDDHWHGTHVAGTAAARDNGDRVIGVAAGAEVVALKVLDSRGSGYNSWVIAGVDSVAGYQVKNGGHNVANMSLGGGVSTALDDAVKAAASEGVLFSLAAGNESDDANNHSPARANHDNIYTISAFGEGDVVASFSNYGNPPIDYAQPGVDVLSLYQDGMAYASGTSMAAPHMAGLLLLYEGNPIIPTDGEIKETRVGITDTDDDPVAVYDGGTITPSNQSPVADFTYTKDKLLVTFDGIKEGTDTRGSYDPDGTISSYSWDYGGNGSVLDDATSKPKYTYTNEGIYTVTLTVEDDKGAKDTYSTDITVDDGINEQPTTEISYSPENVTTGNPVIFTDVSNDPDVNGYIITWEWDFGDGSAKLTYNYNDPDIPDPVTHTYTAPSTVDGYTVILTVTDKDGATAVTSEKVIVTDPVTLPIEFTATGRKVRGRKYVDLFWDKVTDDGSDIFRVKDGETQEFLIKSDIGETGNHTDDLGRSGGTYHYIIKDSNGAEVIRKTVAL